MLKTKANIKSLIEYLRSSGTVVLQGAPGTGKTMLVNFLLKTLGEGEKPIVLDPWDGVTQVSADGKAVPIILVTSERYSGPFNSVLVLREPDEADLGVYVKL